MRPSSRKRTSPSQRLSAWRMAWAIDEPAATCVRVFSSQALSASASGLVFCCRTARRSSALLPRISPGPEIGVACLAAARLSRRVRAMTRADRVVMIDRGRADLSVRRQCALLGLARSGSIASQRPGSRPNNTARIACRCSRCCLGGEHDTQLARR